MEREVFTVLQRVEGVLARPFKILIREPMLIAITIYMSVRISSHTLQIYLTFAHEQFIYGCIYLLFEAYPVVFTKAHHFNAGISGLMFLPIPVGGVVAVTLVCPFILL